MQLVWEVSPEQAALLVVAGTEVGLTWSADLELEYAGTGLSWSLPAVEASPLETFSFPMEMPPEALFAEGQEKWLSTIRLTLRSLNEVGEEVGRWPAPPIYAVWPEGQLELLSSEEREQYAPEGIWFDTEEAEEAALLAVEEGVVLSVASPDAIVEVSP